MGRIDVPKISQNGKNGKNGKAFYRWVIMKSDEHLVHAFAITPVEIERRTTKTLT